LKAVASALGSDLMSLLAQSGPAFDWGPSRQRAEEFPFIADRADDQTSRNPALDEMPDWIF
jgi:hypothetical protein